MGADFLERAKKTIKRSWDRERVALATSDLLTREPGCAGRLVAGEIVGGAKFSPGEKLTVEQDAGASLQGAGSASLRKFPRRHRSWCAALKNRAGSASAWLIRCTTSPESWRSPYVKSPGGSRRRQAFREYSRAQAVVGRAAQHALARLLGLPRARCLWRPCCDGQPDELP